MGHRVFCGLVEVSKGVSAITDPDAVHHLKDVSRVRVGEVIAVCDGKGRESSFRVARILPGALEGEITAVKESAGKAGSGLTVACAVPKNVKFDDIVDKLTQLGVARVVPMHTHRSVVKLDPQKEASRLARWQKIALSASQQSQRLVPPLIGPVMGFKEVLAFSQGFPVKLIPCLTGAREPLTGVVAGPTPLPDILVLIGPEGDFTPGEVEEALGCGFRPVTLGDLVMRVDTAAIAVASYLRIHEIG